VTTTRSLEDIETLRIKLRRIDEFVSTFEVHAEQLRSEVWTEAIIQTENDAPKLLLVIKDSLAEMAKAGLATSFIEEDIEQVRTELGADHQERISALGVSIATRAKRIRGNVYPDPTEVDFSVEVLHLANDIIQLLEEATKPARILRDRFADELSKRSSGITTRKVARRRRDRRIRELAEENPTLNRTELTKLCQEDSVIKATGERVTVHIVREALGK